ncbi:MAG: hypothetical protein J6V33_08065 [Bacteroidales bacterium]|nr:hypothetical protein [Bacteroidales bacterium]
MRKNLFVIALSAVIFGIFGLSSCTKNENSQEQTMGECVIDAYIQQKDIWSEDTAAKDETDNRPAFMCYLFNPDNTCIHNNGGYVSDGLQTTVTRSTTTGRHTMYSIVGLYIEEFPRTSTGASLNSLIKITSPKDISLGKQEFNVTANSLNYTVNISVDHIMSKLSLLVRNVPIDITSIKITLTNQGNYFKFDGTILGDTTMQELELSKATTANSDGTYNWSIQDVIVYPTATAATTMPLQIIAINSNGKSYTFNTSTSSCCYSEEIKYLKTTWDDIISSVTGNITINPWTTEVDEDEFDMGDPIVN